MIQEYTAPRHVSTCPLTPLQFYVLTSHEVRMCAPSPPTHHETGICVVAFATTEDYFRRSWSCRTRVETLGGRETEPSVSS